MQLIIPKIKRLWLKHLRHALLLTTVLCIGALCSTGCAVSKPGSDDFNRQINVFNVSLFSDPGNKVINGIHPRREPCIKGYELYYDSLDFVVSCTNNDRIWKITTRNKQTTLFHISVGDSFSQAKEKMMRFGFIQADTPYKFSKDWCLFTLLVNENNDVFGMAVEVLD